MMRAAFRRDVRAALARDRRVRVRARLPDSTEPPTMSALKNFQRAGHSPTLFAAFLYFAFSCCIWVLNGALAPFISEAYDLTPAQKGPRRWWVP